MANYAIMRIEKIKSITAGNARLRHNRREIKCLNLTNPDAKNKEIICSPEQREIRKDSFKNIFDSRTANQKVRSNAVCALEFVLTFSPDALKPEQLRDWAKSNVDWLAENFGGAKNIIDCQLHLDEKTPHIHAIIIPIDENGKLNARRFVGGTKDRLSELQTSYAKSMEAYALERGICRNITKAIHQDYKRHIADMADREERLRAYETVFGHERTFDMDKYIQFLDVKGKTSTGLKHETIDKVEAYISP